MMLLEMSTVKLKKIQAFFNFTQEYEKKVENYYML